MALNRLAAGLAGLLTLEFYFALEFSDHQPPASSGAQAISGLIKDPWNQSQSVLSEQRAEILDRPLFDPSRRPPVASHAHTKPEELPRLSGIMITPNEKVALFSPTEGNPIIVPQDGRLGAFTVLSIMPDSVTVKGPKGVILLRSNFSYHGSSEKSNSDNTISPGGIDFSQINAQLPSAATWTGPPAAN